MHEKSMSRSTTDGEEKYHRDDVAASKTNFCFDDFSYHSKLSYEQRCDAKKLASFFPSKTSGSNQNSNFTF